MEPQTLDITSMTTEQLESLAYRLVEQKSNIEMNLSMVQQQLAKKRSTVPETVNKEEPEDTDDGEIVHED